MARLAELDLPDRLAPTIPRWATQIGFAVLCSVAADVARLLVNIVAPGSAVFAFIFPAIMVATLFARWPAGAVTSAVSISYSYFAFFLPTAALRSSIDPILSVFAITLSAVLTVALAELFRRAVRRATTERDGQIADRDLFLAEFDHRVKNNFTIVASLLDLQKRRASDPATIEALEAAQRRVDSIARAHRHLYRDASVEAGTVQIRDYLGDLCKALAESLFLRGGILLTCDCDEAAIARDRAVSIGLVVNELVTNAAKHAFPERETGTIAVRLVNRPAGWELSVSDDGVGLSAHPEPAAGSGLGSRLIEAFARQAGGKLHTDSDPTGTRVTLELAA